jgi:ribosomal protein S18 acetylase RimI-like enzyme
MELSVRRLSGTDVKSYRNIRLEALKTFPMAYGTSYKEAQDRSLESFRQSIENSALLGVYCERVLCGIASFQAATGGQSKHIGHIYQMYIRPDRQNNGLGLLLLTTIFKHAETRVKQIHLGVGTQNKAALALYKKAGFEIYGTERRALYINDQYLDEHLMVKFLDQKEDL